jgi:cell division protein FtsB
LASIFTVQGKDYDGSPVGEVLKHLLLSNESFYKDNNIAASKLQGEELVACFSTALPSRKESNMTEQEVTKLKEENEALKEQIKAATAQSADEKVANLESLVQEKTRENLELIAANENLKADVEKFKSPKAIEELNKKVAMQDRQLRAEKIRRLVKSGVESGQFDRALVGDPKTNYEHQSDEMVLSWFKTSAFKDSFERLEIMLETMPKKRLNRTFAAGDYSEPKGIVANEEEKNVLATLGHTPEEIMAALKAKGAGEYAKLTAKKE